MKLNLFAVAMSTMFSAGFSMAASAAHAEFDCVVQHCTGTQPNGGAGAANVCSDMQPNVIFNLTNEPASNSSWPNSFTGTLQFTSAKLGPQQFNINYYVDAQKNFNLWNQDAGAGEVIQAFIPKKTSDPATFVFGISYGPIMSSEFTLSCTKK